MRTLAALAPPATLLSTLAPLHARHAGPADAPFLARLYAATRPDLLGDGSAEPAFAAGLVAMHQRLQLADYRARFPDAEIVLLEQDGAPFARLAIDCNEERVRLVDIALLPEARGRGAGSRILRALQAWAAGAGLPLSLSVQAANPRAHRLYLALGFAPAAAAVQQADGPAAHAVELCWRAP